MAREQWTSGVTAAVLAAALFAGACDDRATARATRNGPRGPAPATAPAPSNPDGPSAAVATNPAGTQPAASYLLVDGRPVEFPAARLRLTRTEDGVRALLFSDDPKNSVSSDYRGNSYYFDVPLRVAEVKDVAGAEYYYKAKRSEPEDDSPNGIFLDGMRVHLQPQDVAIQFSGDAPRVMARLAGRYLVVNTSAHTPPGQFATVTGTLFTSVEVKDE